MYGIEAAGFDDDQTPIRSLPELANRYLSAIEELRLTDGLYLLGWSVGGVIAFDMAQRLAAAGAAPHALILIDSMGRQTVRIPPEREVLRRFHARAPAGERAAHARARRDPRVASQSRLSPDTFSPRLWVPG